MGAAVDGTPGTPSDIIVSWDGGEAQYPLTINVCKATNTWDVMAAKHQLAGGAAPQTTDGITDGYGPGSVWIDGNQNIYFCTYADGNGATWVQVFPAMPDATKADKVPTSPDPTGKVATFDSSGNLVVSAKEVAGYPVAEPTAENDFLVATGSPLAWTVKTLAEVKVILGIT